MEAGTINIASQKTEVPRLVPLSEAVRRVLRKFPRFEGNPHVFPGRVEGKAFWW